MKFTTLDIGNTHSRYTCWNDQQMMDDLQAWSESVNRIGLGDIVVSNVGDPTTHKWASCIDLKDYLKNGKLLDMPVNYTQTIGADRLATAYAVYKTMINTKQSTNEIMAVIDAGTFITIDLVTHEGLSGGFILPGYQTLLNAYQSGRQLPKLSTSQNYNYQDIPHTTDDAILSGTQIMVESSIKNILNTWRIQSKQVVITGGDRDQIGAFLAGSQISKTLIHLGLKEFYFQLKAGPA